MTLVLIVVAALSEASLARRSLQLALDAQQGQEEISERWAARSLRLFLLNRADDVFWSLEEQSSQRSPQWPVASCIDLDFAIGKFHACARLADEDARINLNRVYARRPAGVRNLLLNFSAEGVALSLSPDLSRDATLRKRWYQSWGQVFDIPEAFERRQWQQLLTTTTQVTCFGGGKPNIRRAMDATIQASLQETVSPETSRKLLEARRGFEGDLLLPELLAKLALRRGDALKLRGALSDRSSCYSLWLALEDRSRTRYHLWVAGDASSAGEDSLLSFTW